MTVVQWLLNELWDAPKDKFIWHSILDKAKEMEKQQITDTCKENLQVEISDEEIKDVANRLGISTIPMAYFIDGALWYREQVKSKFS